MKIKRLKGYTEKLERVKGTRFGVWDICLDCGKKIAIIEGYEGRCVCKECKLKPKKEVK